MNNIHWVMHGYDYGPVAFEIVGIWLPSMLIAALLAYLIGWFFGPAEQIARFILLVVLMAGVAPLVILNLGLHLPSQHPDEYWVDKAAYQRWEQSG